MLRAPLLGFTAGEAAAPPGGTIASSRPVTQRAFNKLLGICSESSGFLFVMTQKPTEIRVKAWMGKAFYSLNWCFLLSGLWRRDWAIQWGNCWCHKLLKTRQRWKKQLEWEDIQWVPKKSRSAGRMMVDESASHQRHISISFERFLAVM